MEEITEDTWYPLSDYHPAMHDHINMLASWDGRRKRCPKYGEWYIAESVFDVGKVYAYQAPRNMTTAQYIVGRIIGTKIKVIKDVVEIPLI